MAVTTGRFVGDPRGFLSPSLHRQRIATLRHDRIEPPCVLDGPINSESSKGYIEHFLVPTLMPGDIVIRTQFFEVGVIPLRPHRKCLGWPGHPIEIQACDGHPSPRILLRGRFSCVTTGPLDGGLSDARILVY